MRVTSDTTRAKFVDTLPDTSYSYQVATHQLVRYHIDIPGIYVWHHDMISHDVDMMI